MRVLPIYLSAEFLLHLCTRSNEVPVMMGVGGVQFGHLYVVHWNGTDHQD